MRKYITIFIGLLFVIAAWAVWVPAKVNLPHSLVRLLMSEDHTDVGSRSFGSGKKISMIAQNDLNSPTICWDAGSGCNDGLNQVDNNLMYVINGSAFWTWNNTIFGPNAGDHPVLRHDIATATLPGFAFTDDLVTGLGHAAANQGSLIAGGLQILQFDGTVSSGASVWTDGGIVIGDISGATVSPASGQTSFILIISGASPVGSPVNASTFYTFNDLMYAQNPAGDVIQITPHDPETGEIYTNTYNVYTGKGIKYYPISGISIEYTVPKADWTAVQVRHQKKVFINSYTQQTIEVPQGQATDFPDIEEGTGFGVTKYKFQKGKKVAYWKENKKKVRGKFKTIKPHYWMDEEGKFWRKRTRAEATTAFNIDMAAIGSKWDNLAPFLKAEIQDPRL